MRAGDVLFCAGTGPEDRAIRLAQRLRHTAPHAEWTHVGLVVSAGGDTIEATRRGVGRYHVHKHTEPVLVVDTEMTAADRAEAVRFAESCLGDPYGWLTILGVGLALLTGGHLDLGADAHLICSGLVSQALERGPYCWSRDASNMTPADLAAALEVEYQP